MEKQQKQLHIVMFPWFAMGHMTPFLQPSNEFGDRGHKITFLLPNKAKLLLQDSVLHPSLINLHSINVPHVDPLQVGTEIASEIPIQLTTHLATTLDLTRPEVESVLEGLHPKPDILFYDMAHWAPAVASRLGIKSVSYNVVCAASLAIALVPDRPVSEENVAQTPPGYPSSNVVLHGHDARSLLFIAKEFGSGTTFYLRITTAMRSAHVIAIRTCHEIEGNFCDYVSAQYNRPSAP